MTIEQKSMTSWTRLCLPEGRGDYKSQIFISRTEFAAVGSGRAVANAMRLIASTDVE